MYGYDSPFCIRISFDSFLKEVIYMPKKKFNVALSSKKEIFLRFITHTGNGYSLVKSFMHGFYFIVMITNQLSKRIIGNWLNGLAFHQLL